MRSPRGCALFFRVSRRAGGLAIGIGLSCSCFSFRSFRTVLSGVPYGTTKETKVVGETSGLFGDGELAVFTEFFAQVRGFLVGVGGSQRSVAGWGRFFAGPVGIVRLRRGCGLIRGLLSLLLGGLGAALSLSLFLMFPVSSVDGLGKCSELRQRCRLAYSRAGRPR